MSHSPDPPTEDVFVSGYLAPRPLSRLTYRILSLNMIVVVTMVMSLGILNRTRESLIRNEIENFATESSLYAALFSEKALPSLQGKQTLLADIISKVELRPDQKIMVADESGTLLLTAGELSLRPSFAEKKDKNLDVLSRLLAAAEDSLSVEFSLPPYPGQNHILSSQISTVNSQEKDVTISAWSAPDGGLILSSKFSIEGKKDIPQNIFLVRRDIQLEETYANTRMDIIRFLAVSLVITASFSLYLAAVIGHPLRKLAQSAESFRLRKGQGVEIPDMSLRKDEIGELSEAMRDMASALSSRILAIEQFAADVAHELKNPLTSMKSAVETLRIVKKDEDRSRLNDILLHDIIRMNRLISDISQASRLDAELSRDELVELDLRDVILPLVATRSHSLMPEEHKIICSGFENPVMVLGQHGRLAQVFDNLIANALSFSAQHKKVMIHIHQNEDRIKVTVEDEGPGIPINRLNKIFERFYSERPVAEGFGMHSGLGLSIAKQIIEAHGGAIHAENRLDNDGHIMGARFVVRLRVLRA